MISLAMTALSPPVQAVVSLFSGPLASVRFADIDAAGLGNLAAEVESAALEVAAQEAKLVELRQALAQRQEALLGLAQQALAYARVYAEGDEALSTELNAIALPRAAKPRKVAAAAKGASARVERADALPTADAEALPTDASSNTSSSVELDDATSACESEERTEHAAEAAPEHAVALARRKGPRQKPRVSSNEDAV